jgi:peptide/nickel transport system permease protein
MAKVTMLSPADIEALQAASADFEVQLESLNQWQLIWRRFRRHRMAVLGSTLFFGMIAIGIVGPFILPFDYYHIPPPDQVVYAGRAPTLTPFLPFGETGGLQRSVFVLVINGIRLSLLIGVGATIISTILGALVGGISGYFGGITDTIAMRTVDALLSLPLLFVILVFTKFLGSGSWFLVMVIFALFGWLSISRLVRSAILSLREQDYVDAARAAGVSDLRIIFRHLLPNALSPIIVAATLSVAAVIIGEAFVSFLGFGVDVTQPTLGNVLSGALDFVSQGNWWWAFFPGAAIVIIVLGISFMGDGLQDAFDPRAKI